MLITARKEAQSHCMLLGKISVVNLFSHAECDKDILKCVDCQLLSVKYRGTNFELGNRIGPKK